MKLGCCDEEIRFMFTRLSSYAQDFAPNGATVPDQAGNEGGGTIINANVDAIFSIWISVRRFRWRTGMLRMQRLL